MKVLRYAIDQFRGFRLRRSKCMSSRQRPTDREAIFLWVASVHVVKDVEVHLEALVGGLVCGPDLPSGRSDRVSRGRR